MQSGGDDVHWFPGGVCPGSEGHIDLREKGVMSGIKGFNMFEYLAFSRLGSGRD